LATDGGGGGDGNLESTWRLEPLPLVGGGVGVEEAEEASNDSLDFSTIGTLKG
jgi:hypothetical protein